jgi:hypothetical protein
MEDLIAFHIMEVAMLLDLLASPKSVLSTITCRMLPNVLLIVHMGGILPSASW